MNKEKQRIAIAEACGWYPVSYHHLKHVQYWAHKELGSTQFLPDYVFDLNAMHEAEKVFNTSFHEAAYDNEVFRVVHREKMGNGVSTFDKIHATAAQRAEAFLRTLGKWEEE